jgi:urease accessory protein
MSPALLSLLQLCDPALPIGGYAHSGGLETYVQAGVVSNRGTAEDFIREMLARNLYYTDAALVSLSYAAVMRMDDEDLLELDVLCEAVKFPKEIRQASQKLGMRLLKVFQGIFSGETLTEEGSEGTDEGKMRDGTVEKIDKEDERLFGVMREYNKTVQTRQTPGHYCIAFGVCAAALGIGLREVLTGYYYNAAAGMVTNCVKLIPMGQQDGQELLFSLHSLIGELVGGSLEPDRELIGVCCSGFDIRCMQHEQLYSRLYMS